MNNRTAWIATTGAAAIALSSGVFLEAGTYLWAVAGLFLVLSGLIALMVQLEQPFLGLALLVVTAVVLPVEFRGPSAAMMSSSLPLATFFCGAWLLGTTSGRRSSPLEASRVMYAALALMGTTLLSFVMGQFPWFPSGGAPLPAQTAELGLVLVSGCLFLAVGHQISSVAQLRWLTWMFIAAGVVLCVMQTVPGLDQLDQWTTRTTSVGSLFWTWLVALSFAQALFNRNLPVPARLFLLAVNVLVFYHGLVQVRSWASGWLPPLVAVCVILLVRLPRVSFGVALLAVPAGLSVAGYLSTWLLGEEEYSLSTRTEAWQALWQLVERSPVLGTGLTNYYYYTENIQIRGWYVRFISHNNYQDMLVQTGFVGLLAFLWFALEAYWMMTRLYRHMPAGFPRAYVVGAFGGLTGSLVSGMLGDWIVPFYYNAGILGFRSSLLFWVFLGGILALKRMTFGAREAEASVSWSARQRGPSKFVEAH